MATMNRWLVGLLSFGAVLSCDSIADSEYLGEPLGTFDGQIMTLDRLGSEAPVRVSLFWNPELSADFDEKRLSEQGSATVTIGFPTRFRLNLFHPPSTAQRPPGLPWAAAWILAYQDRNGNGLFDSSELIGGTNSTTILWTERSLTASESPTGRPVNAGFSLSRGVLNCAGQQRAPSRPRECGTPLGASCNADEDCGTGLCLNWLPGGYCVLPESSGCIPTGDTLVDLCDPADINNEEQCYLKTCSGDDECRQDEGYACIANTCAPDEPVTLYVQGDFVPAQMCVDDERIR